MDQPFDPLNPVFGGCPETRPRRGRPRARTGSTDGQGHVAKTMHEWRSSGALAKLDGAQARVLLYLVSRAEFDASQKTRGGRIQIAEATGLHPRSVRRAIDGLVASGFIKREETPAGVAQRYSLGIPS